MEMSWKEDAMMDWSGLYECRVFANYLTFVIQKSSSSDSKLIDRET